MTRHVLIRVSDDADAIPVILGISTNHAELNGIMQREYDDHMTEYGDRVMAADDSDASHFYVETGDEGENFHWYISEYKTF